MRKILALILCLIIILPAWTFTGCNNIDTDEPSTSSSEGDTDTEPTDETLSMASLFIDTDHLSDVTTKEDYTTCKVTLANCKAEYSFDDAPAGIRLRGNSTSESGSAWYAMYYQVPYRIKFETKQSMLGLNDGAKCKSWVLLLPNPNNIMALSLAKTILGEDGYYSSDYSYINLYLNGKYKGVFILAEQSQINKNRVDVYECEVGYQGTDVGYLLEIDNYPQDEVYTFSTNFYDLPLVDIEGGKLAKSTLKVDGSNIHTRYYTIKNNYASQTQISFIKNYINYTYLISYYAIVYNQFYEMNSNTTGYAKSSIKDAKELISKYVDLRSLVDMYLVQEFSKNTDVGAGSFYMSIDFSANSTRKTLTFECPWDFDWAFYETSRFSDQNKVSYEGLSACTFCSSDFAWENASRRDRSNPWLILFMKADWFREMVNERYKEILDKGTIDNSIAELRKYQTDFASDFEKEKETWIYDPYDIDEAIDNLCYYSENRKTWLKDKFEEIAKIKGTK